MSRYILFTYYGRGGLGRGTGVFRGFSLGTYRSLTLQNMCRWDQGLLEMCIGEKRKLTIPPELAYGNRAMGPIPAGSTLIFETELVGIEGVGKDEL